MAGRDSLAEKIRVRTGTPKANRIIIGVVNQNPIGFDMKVAAWLPFAFQRMEARLTRKGFADQ